SLPGINDNSKSGEDARSVVFLSRAREALSQEDAYLNGIASVGQLAKGEPGELAELIGVQRFMFADLTVKLPDPDREAYRTALLSEAASSIRVMEDSIVAEAKAGSPLPIDITAWRNAYDSLRRQLREVEFAASESILSSNRPGN